MVQCPVRDQLLNSSCSFCARRSRFVSIFGLTLTLCAALASCAKPSRVNCTNVSSEYQHCGIHPAGVHDLDCFLKYPDHFKCVWKPGKPTSENYTLITRQLFSSGEYCNKYVNITVSETIKISKHKNLTAEIFENSNSTKCTRAVFRGSTKSWTRCGPPHKVSLRRCSGKLHVNVSWPQEDKNIIDYYSMKYKTLKSQSWNESVVRCQTGNNCMVENLSPSLIYNMQMQCVINDKCSQCPWSEIYTILPELTTQPVIDIIEDNDNVNKNGTRLLFLKWTFPAKEPHDGYTVIVRKASGETPDERMTTTRPEIRLVLSYSAFHISISAFNSISTSPAANKIIGQRDDASGFRDGRLNVTVHSNKSFTLRWKDNLVKSYFFCYSVEWRRKGHKTLHKSFFEDEKNNWTISIPSDKDHLKPYKRYDVLLHTRPDKQTCNMKRINNSESTYGSTQFYFSEGTPVAAPANISVHNVTLNSVVLEWSSITEEDARGFLLGYTIHYTENRPRGIEINVTVPAESNHYRLEDLRSGTAYEIRISGFTRAGVGVESTWFIFKTHHQGYFHVRLRSIITVFTIVLTVVIVGPIIIQRTKVIVWPNIPNPGHSNAVQKMERTRELELLEFINTLKVEEWDTSSLQIVEKERVIPAKPSPHLQVSEEEACSWSQTDTEDPPGGLPPNAPEAPHLQSSPLTYLSGYTTMEMFNHVMPRCVIGAEKRGSEDADLTVVKSGLDYIRQFSSSPTWDSEVSTFL